MHLRFRSISILFVVLLLPALTKAQSVEKSATYVSQADSDLTIKRVTLLPVSDNVEGIYARPIEAQLETLIRGTHRWDFTESNITGSLAPLVELEEKPALVQQSLQPIDAEAAFAASATRGPNGISIRVDLFLKKDGKLLAQETLKDHGRFEIPEIREQVNQLYRRLVGKLPYDGFLMSRQGNRVTINLGKSDGIRKDQTLTAVQIIAVNRHPKFGFILSTEKEILGTIKVLKVDDTLSFGAIVTEKERGAIQRFAKIAGVEPVNYGEPDSLTPETKEAGVGSRPDAPVVFGKDPHEWLPVNPPSFGQVGLMLGLGTFTTSVSKNGQTKEGSSYFYPNAILSGELWLNPNWITKIELRQGIVTTSNPDTTSNAGNVNYLVSRYELGVGYNFLLRDDFFGPKIQVSGGFFNYRVSVAESSLLTTGSSGMELGINGSFPIFDDKIWYLGAGMNLVVGTKATDFKIFTEKKIAENMRAVANLEFSAYESGKDGYTLVQKHTVLTVGLNYMF